jgi:hypothetical protein
MGCVFKDISSLPNYKPQPTEIYFGTIYFITLVILDILFFIAIIFQLFSGNLSSSDSDKYHILINIILILKILFLVKKKSLRAFNNTIIKKYNYYKTNNKINIKYISSTIEINSLLQIV